jgi:hypothetical protein
LAQFLEEVKNNDLLVLFAFAGQITLYGAIFLALEVEIVDLLVNARVNLVHLQPIGFEMQGKKLCLSITHDIV